MNGLTERRKADRKKMATDLFETVVAYPLKEITLTEEGRDEAYPRAWILAIKTHNGLACRFEFDGESCQPDVFVNAWHMVLDTDARLSDRFPGSVNQAHFRKSTTVCDGFSALKSHVVAVLEGDKAGWIYDSEREAAAVAKDGSWQERKARFDAWSEERAAQRAAEGR